MFEEFDETVFFFLPSVSSTRFSIIVFLIVFTYIAGENNKFFSNKMLFWNKNCNPIFWVIAVTSFNIFRKIKIKSSFINNISKYSLLIYYT